MLLNKLKYTSGFKQQKSYSRAHSTMGSDKDDRERVAKCQEIIRHIDAKTLPPVFFRAAELASEVSLAAIAMIVHPSHAQLLQIVYSGYLNQVCRCSSSIAANIAEGNGRGTVRQALGFYQTARGSLKETVYFTTLLPEPFCTRIHEMAVNFEPQFDEYMEAVAMAVMNQTIGIH